MAENLEQSDEESVSSRHIGKNDGTNCGRRRSRTLQLAAKKPIFDHDLSRDSNTNKEIFGLIKKRKRHILDSDCSLSCDEEKKVKSESCDMSILERIANENNKHIFESQTVIHGKLSGANDYSNLCETDKSSEKVSDHSSEAYTEIKLQENTENLNAVIDIKVSTDILCNKSHFITENNMNEPKDSATVLKSSPNQDIDTATQQDVKLKDVFSQFKYAVIDKKLNDNGKLIEETNKQIQEALIEGTDKQVFETLLEETNKPDLETFPVHCDFKLSEDYVDESDENNFVGYVTCLDHDNKFASVSNVSNMFVNTAAKQYCCQLDEVNAKNLDGDMELPELEKLNKIHKPSNSERSFFGELYKMLGKNINENASNQLVEASSLSSKKNNNDIIKSETSNVTNIEGNSTAVMSKCNYLTESIEATCTQVNEQNRNNEIANNNSEIITNSNVNDASINCNNDSSGEKRLTESEQTKLAVQLTEDDNETVNIIQEPLVKGIQIGAEVKLLIQVASAEDDLNNSDANYFSLVTEPDSNLIKTMEIDKDLTLEVNDAGEQYLTFSSVLTDETSPTKSQDFIAYDSPLPDDGVIDESFLPLKSVSRNIYRQINRKPHFKKPHSLAQNHTVLNSSNIKRYCADVLRVARLRKKIIRLVRTLFPHLRVALSIGSHSPQVEVLMNQIINAINGSDANKKMPEPSQVVAEKGLLSLRVVLCKTPLQCLHHLRLKTLHLLRTLLPLLTFEDSAIDTESDFVENLIDLVIKHNKK